MTILQHIFNIGTSEAHPSVEELKEPIQKAEQAIRDMRLELEKNVRALETLGKEETNAGSISEGPDSGKPSHTRAELEQNNKALKTNLRKNEMQLRVLKSRVTVSSATKTINRQMAQLNSPGSLTLLENLRREGTAGQSQTQGSGENGSETKDQTGAPEKPQDASTAQAFTQKADALNEKLGLAPSTDAHTIQP
ncbi:hypothetical protein [Rufibacter aurantiacus]|uniref:hypothetical protein n=1 Tax=Rufibacter aurantiacus TaxID=2817374 RepID=UPI001B303A7A|nr:hypothetical protein [Rufibacter aurantiacus]